ncbi:MAG: ferredoxin [Piptocephalis tieghemiana]|nr:MAG: ferredoxin [Piptocephalis tieghemiana]
MSSVRGLLMPSRRLLGQWTRRAQQSASALAPLNTGPAKMHQTLPQSRWLSTTSVWRHGGSGGPATLKVHFITAEGETITADAAEGDSLLDVAHENDVELEGACEGSLACSTCHVILEDDVYDSLEEPSDEENDMLDLAFGLTETSRLGCQVIMSKDLDGIHVKLPSATRNMAVDGYKPKPH